MVLAVVVNSCSQYARATLPPLLESLRAAGVPAAHVFVVVGDAPAHDTLVGPAGYEVAAKHRPWCNMDNNAFVWIADEGDALRGFDWIFYTHDTSLVDPGFYESAMRLCENAPPGTDAYKLQRNHSMSTGLYRVRALWDVGAAISATKNLDPARTLEVKAMCEDSVFRLLRGVDALPNEYTVESEGVTMYGTDVPRIVEHWVVPGLRKVKANWGQAPLKCEL